ncbi:MAG: DUF3363 domain-containing protein, partial [Planctomycetales bacterium]|nr:DUF3363 domain-containing protein [Planctomycetales bacterium]
DRQAVSHTPTALADAGFGADVKDAMDRRAEHLIGQGLAERRGRHVIFARNLLSNLRDRELVAVGARLAAETSRTFRATKVGEYIAGVYQRRLTLASGRFAMIDDGFGFQLVPWTPSLEKNLGRHMSGIVRGSGGVDWGVGKKRGLGL